MISLAESGNSPEVTSPLRMEDRLERALSTLERYVNQLAQDNNILREELATLQDQHAGLQLQFEEACKANDLVSQRLDKSINQLKLVLEEN